MARILSCIQFKHLLLAVCFFSGYLLLLLFFYKVDVYHQYFFANGFIILVYHFFRIFFIACLMWLCYALGDFTLYCFKEKQHREFTLTSALLTFFAGLSVWHIILLCMGFAGGYTRILMVVMTLSVFVISLPRLSQWIRFAESHRSSVYWPGIILLFFPAFFFLFNRGLYPSGGHDYFTHYFPYFREVIESGNLFPHRLWYHFYYDKGMGLFFLSMLLTDPLAPQLVTTVMIVAASGIIFLLIRQATPWRLLPWIGVAFYLFFLIYTPGPPEAMRQTGWGDLEKSHEPAALLMFAIIWITINLASTKNQKLWRIVLLLNASALAIMSLAIAFFAGVYLSVTMICYFIYKNKSAALSILWTLLAMGGWFILLLLVNYLLTGLPDEQSALVWWPLINFNQVKAWGGLIEISNLHFNRTTQASSKVPLSFEFIKNIIFYLRLDIWGPLLLIILMGSLCDFNRRRKAFIAAKETKMAIYVLGGFLILTAILALIIGRDQSVSFYRFTSFTYAPTLCLCFLLLAIFFIRQNVLASLLLVLGFLYAFSAIGNHDFIPFHHPYKVMICLSLLLIIAFYPKIRFAYFPLLSLFLLWIVVAHLKLDNKNFFQIIKNGNRFARGSCSIAAGYQHQEGRPGAMPWGGIYPPMEKIWFQLPKNTRIWSWHVHSYCMLPDCDVEGFESFLMSKHEEIVYFGDPKKAKELLKKENLNYFFFSTQLNVRDILFFSPLFSPQHIADYLGIAWTDGNNTLLTWKENAKFPLTAQWLSQYKKQNHYVYQGRLHEIKQMYQNTIQKLAQKG